MLISSMLKKTIGLMIASSVLISGCTSARLPTATVDSRPKTAAIRSSTALTAALACLDRKLAKRQIQPVQIAVGSMPDTTGKVSISMRDMTIDALVKATQISGAFEVIDQIVGSLDGSLLAGGGGLPQPSMSSTRRLPNSAFNLTGSITQVSQGEYEAGFDAAIDTANGGPGVRFLSQLSSLGTHMRMTRSYSGQVRFSSKLEVTLKRTSNGLNLFAGVPGAGVYLGFSVEAQDSVSKAVETLIQLHVLELLGQAANVPYWDCLAKKTNAPSLGPKNAVSWRKMNNRERAASAKRMLVSMGYEGPQSKAIQRFQLDASIPPTGVLDFATFLALKERADNDENTQLISMRKSSISPQFTRLEIGVTRSAYVTCFYRAEDGVIAKILPNPHQPQSFLTAGRTHIVPDVVAEKRFRILTPKRGLTQGFLCAASEKPFPKSLSKLEDVSDFRDLRSLGFKTLKAIANTYERLGKARTVVLNSFNSVGGG